MGSQSDLIFLFALCNMRYAIGVSIERSSYRPVFLSQLVDVADERLVGCFNYLFVFSVHVRVNVNVNEFFVCSIFWVPLLHSSLALSFSL